MIRPRVIVSRVMEAGLVVVGLAVLWVGAPNAGLLIWDVLTAVYVGIWAVRLWRHRREEDPEEWLVEVQGTSRHPRTSACAFGARILLQRRGHRCRGRRGDRRAVTSPTAHASGYGAGQISRRRAAATALWRRPAS